MQFQTQHSPLAVVLFFSGLLVACAPAPGAPPVARSTGALAANPPASVAATPGGQSPTLAGCPVFPPDNPWNQRVDGDPVDPASDQYLASMNADDTFLHADFGGDGDYGIPFTTVSGSQPRVPMTFDYEDESDPGPYPIPSDAPIESGSDRHILVVDRESCVLYETWDTHRAGEGWHAGAGAVFDLRSNDLRPAGWTSADAAGLPILPGLVRHDEVQAGRIAHALRFTVQRTQRAYLSPARHFASPSTDPARPPMGLRVRLKAGFDLAGFGPTAQVVLTALKEYGMFLADNGGDWFITGEANPAWDDDELAELASVPASAFEVVQHGPLEF
jgi:hypothetical protein